MLLASAIMTHLRLWPIATLPLPVVMSLAGLGLDTAADGVFLCPSLLVCVNDAAELLLEAQNSSTFEPALDTLRASLSW